MAMWTIDIGDRKVIIETQAPGQPPRVKMKLRDRDDNPVDEVDFSLMSVQKIRLTLAAASGEATGGPTDGSMS